MLYIPNVSTAVYILAAVLPAFFLLRYIYRHDTIEKEPPALLALMLLGGVGATVVAIVLEKIGGEILDYLFYYSPIYFSSLTYDILLAFVVVACVEEGAKLFFLKLFSWKNPNFNYVFDAVVYAVFVSLGFAAVENIKYVFTYGLSVALTRAVTAIPGHLSFSVFMGIFYGRARLCEAYGNETGKKTNLVLSFLIPVLLHGFYDACAMIGTTLTSIVFLIFIIVLYIIVFRLIKSASYHDRPIY